LPGSWIPSTAVAANCDLLLEDIAPDDPHRPEVAAIRDAVERATELTHRLCRLGAVQPLESELVDLNDLVRAVEQELAAIVGGRIALATALEPRFSPITADPREQ
jgi:two-component system, cell cycle sensor histidine kinase and response regulator CckA